DVNVERERDDFLQFDITSLKAEQTLSSMMAANVHARRDRDGLQVDTDRDGLSDPQEFELHTDTLEADTDEDGYGDLFEDRHRSVGFDPIDADKPAVACVDTDDRDRDGLNGCEEAYLGT